MNRELEQQVWARAAGRCEYCRFPQAIAELPFEADHIIAKKHRGETASENLALAYFYCNSYKGPNVAGIDPDTDDNTPLYHPRRDTWSDHFQWDGPELIGRTAVGRTTIDVLRINHPDAINVRASLIEEGIFP